MRPARATPRSPAAFTLMEVMVSAALIAVAIGSIVTINLKTFDLLVTSRSAAASSQVLQQRIERIRDSSWVEVASAPAMAAFMGKPAESEVELANTQLVETMKVTVPRSTAAGPVESDRSFTVRRAGGVVSTSGAGDFAREVSLFYEGTVTWQEKGRAHTRTLRTLVCRAGLTRNGITGSLLGRPGTEVSGP